MRRRLNNNGSNNNNKKGDRSSNYASTTKESTPLRQASFSETPEDILADSGLYKTDDRPFWKRKRFHFIVGVSVGALAAIGAASTTPTAQNHFNELQTYLALQLADIDFGGATDVVDELFGNVTGFFKPSPSSDIPFMPALSLKDELDLKPHYPVVLIPGIISSGLESWGTSEKSQKYFRKRMWGTTTMFRSVLLDKDLWTEHLKLDSITGLDPEPGIKIRAAQGLDAADYFVTGYWVWARIIENLAAIGYDSTNMHLASYDWRLSFSNLEIRDHYFSKLKSIIETGNRNEGRKTVIVTHSMGSILFPYFLKWVEHPDLGKGGASWTEQNIETFVNIGGPALGVPKALAAMLSGETRDTMALGSFGAYLLEKFFSRRERANLLRTWGGASSMLPKGGELLWGTNNVAPDDPTFGFQGDHLSYGNMISFTKSDAATAMDKGGEDHDERIRNHTAQSSIELLHENSSKEYHDMLRTNYSFGISTDKKQLKLNDMDETKWSNPLESQLPNAPNMKIYCMYGVNLPTERSYYYAKTKKSYDEIFCDESNMTDARCQAQERAQRAKEEYEEKAKEFLGSSFTNTMDEVLRPPELFINPDAHDPINGVETGVRFADGDGTVPVLSLGYMCEPKNGGWTKHADLYNPAHIPVVLREYKHEESESKLDVRGGRKAGDHVDILGNWEMISDILQIVSNKGNNVTQRIFSDIERYAANIHLV
ncbi:Lecithin:cholesterol acyltransferase-domain-containing protein [Phascolomyces articulosus]|uniref:Lecithin:cholesterol acyltransferase-domain-containing protein n=1 Tax=Phascolomyces articulosus TaxID=60185 RepID=A0AAD5KAG3_9FUNG|nr:Lecithin:cholesterol acyltransferase-domain-containing protein [Phascolomyces articulosus]